jgi:hypothetical protein
MGTSRHDLADVIALAVARFSGWGAERFAIFMVAEMYVGEGAMC